MTGLALSLWMSAGLAAAEAYRLEGRLDPGVRAAVSLHGATTPFADSTLASPDGRFQFRKVQAGTYTVAVFVPGRGETRRTISVGPSLADKEGRVSVTIPLEEERFVTEEAWRGRAKVSKRELSIPDKARREYQNAQKKLGRRDIDGAIAHLEKAVEMAPQFAEAWNNLGTIAYQTRRFPQAEEYFRRGLEEDPEAFEPLVNLGGVLLTLEKLDEALKYNLFAVLRRPNDALANSQLGMTYFYVGNLDLAEKYLREAHKLDPGHFSHPQLLLAEVHLRKGRREEAAAMLEDFISRHPDDARAEKLRETARRMRK